MDTSWIAAIAGGALVAVVIVLVAWLFRRMDVIAATMAGRLDSLADQQERTERSVREQLATSRQEQGVALRDMRYEVGAAAQDLRDAVTEQLEQVYRGLGEMQSLAAGVGDLKRVLANVRVRGTWGEVQLGNLLEQVLAPDQYATNVATREGSDERVEFAVRLPGTLGEAGQPVWLPVDAKFPLEDYQRLLEASEHGDTLAADAAARELEARVRSSARAIGEKYLDVPRTTDFAILFLPVEGLYAEVLRRPGLVESLQQNQRVLVAGPTTLWAILTSLRLGFRTLAIQKRTSEVWGLLAAVKTDFARFGALLDGVQKKLGEASTRIDEARRGSRRIERRLHDVQDGPAADEEALPAPVSEEAVNERGQEAAAPAGR